MGNQDQVIRTVLLTASCRNGPQRRHLKDSLRFAGRKDLADAVGNAEAVLLEAARIAGGRIPADVYEAVTVTAETCLYAGGIEETAMTYHNEGHEDLANSVVNAFQALADVLISLSETDVGRASGWFRSIPTKGDES